MPGPTRTIQDARRSVQAEQERARDIAKQQQESVMRRGYSRSGGFDAPVRARNPYLPEVDRPLEPTPPVIADDSMKPRTTRRVFGVGQGD